MVDSCPSWEAAAVVGLVMRAAVGSHTEEDLEATAAGQVQALVAAEGETQDFDQATEAVADQA